jgi:hypothetical protein
MINNHPKRLILIGFFLVLLGFVLPFLMTLHTITPTYFLSFVSWGSTMGGLFLGLIGVANYMRLRKD